MSSRYYLTLITIFSLFIGNAFAEETLVAELRSNKDCKKEANNYTGHYGSKDNFACVKFNIRRDDGSLEPVRSFYRVKCLDNLCSEVSEHTLFWFQYALIKKGDIGTIHRYHVLDSNGERSNFIYADIKSRKNVILESE